MKLTVKYVEKRIASNDPFDKLINNVSNQSAALLTKELQKRLKNAVCGVHLENSKGTITIVAGDKMKVQKSNFCCKEFEDRINITG